MTNMSPSQTRTRSSISLAKTMTFRPQREEINGYLLAVARGCSLSQKLAKLTSFCQYAFLIRVSQRFFQHNNVADAKQDNEATQDDISRLIRWSQNQFVGYGI